MKCTMCFTNLFTDFVSHFMKLLRLITCLSAFPLSKMFFRVFYYMEVVSHIHVIVHTCASAYPLAHLRASASTSALTHLCKYLRKHLHTCVLAHSRMYLRTYSLAYLRKYLSKQVFDVGHTLYKYYMYKCFVFAEKHLRNYLRTYALTQVLSHLSTCASTFASTCALPYLRTHTLAHVLAHLHTCASTCPSKSSTLALHCTNVIQMFCVR